MGALIHAAGPYDINFRPTQDLFEALCESIVYQQLSGKAASTIFGRFLELFPGSDPPAPEHVLRIDTDRLRSAGLSGAKTAAIQDLADKTIANLVPTTETMHDMSDEEISTRLTNVRGIGPWTVQMLLIFRLGRPDVMPATDLGIRKGFALVYGWDELPPPKHIMEHSEQWMPFRSVASWYLWRSLDLKDFAPGRI
jgi:DNA-3-methyladenine glycosylase II